MKKIYILFTTLILSISLFAIPTGNAPITSGYTNDNNIVSLTDDNSIQETSLILQGATKNRTIKTKPTKRTDLTDTSGHVKVEILNKTNEYIDWKVTFNGAHIDWDRPNMSISISKNLRVSNLRYEEIIGDDNNSKRITQAPKIYTNFLTFLEEWKKSLNHYLPNGLSNDQISRYDNGKTVQNKIGNGIFVLDYTTGKRDQNSLNKLGRAVGTIYYFKDYRVTQWYTKNSLVVTFRTNAIDTNNMQSGSEEFYFVEATIMSRQDVNDYVSGYMLLNTIKKNVNTDKYLHITNTFYGLTENDTATIDMSLNVNNKNKTYRFNYDNMSPENSKFSKNFIVSGDFLSSNNINLTTSNNYIIKKDDIKSISNGYSMNINYFNIGEYNYLNNKQKNYYIEELKKIVNGSDKDKIHKFTNLRNEAIGTENAMRNLQEEINKEGIKNTGKYLNATEQQKRLYDLKLSDAKNLLNKERGELTNKATVVEFYENLKNAREALNGQDELSGTREESKTNIDNFDNLNDSQKRNLKTEIENSTTNEEINTILEKAKKLDDKMYELKLKIKDVESIKNTYEYQNDETNNRNTLDTYLREANRLISSDGENKNIEYIDELIKKLEITYQNIKNTSLAKYDELAKKFYDVDTSIENNFDRTFYTNFDFGVGILNLSKKIVEKEKRTKADFPTNIQLGFNINAIKELKLGGFIEYKNKDDAHILGVGINSKFEKDNHNFINFVRYRMINFEKIFNHNVDIYLKYYYNLEFGNLKLSPKIGTLITYSTKTLLDEDVYLKDRVSVILDNTNRLAYEFKNINSKIYFDIIAKIGINTNQIIYRESNNSNKRNIYHNLFEIEGVFGYEQKIKDFLIDTNISLNDKMNMKFKIGGSYNKEW